jgi:hypothetical protein
LYASSPRALYCVTPALPQLAVPLPNFCTPLELGLYMTLSHRQTRLWCEPPQPSLNSFIAQFIMFVNRINME